MAIPSTFPYLSSNFPLADLLLVVSRQNIDQIQPIKRQIITQIPDVISPSNPQSVISLYIGIQHPYPKNRRGFPLPTIFGRSYQDIYAKH